MESKIRYILLNRLFDVKAETNTIVTLYDVITKINNTSLTQCLKYTKIKIYLIWNKMEGKAILLFYLVVFASNNCHSSKDVNDVLGFDSPVRSQGKF